MDLHAYFAAQATRCRTDADYMALALVAAEISGARGEVPVGAVLVHKDRGFLAYGVNGRESAKNALWHAEMEAIDRGCRALGGWRLTGCTLYVTLEPCPMCAGAMGSVFAMQSYPVNWKPAVRSGVRERECRTVLQTFFRARRG